MKIAGLRISTGATDQDVVGRRFRISLSKSANSLHFDIKYLMNLEKSF